MTVLENTALVSSTAAPGFELFKYATVPTKLLSVASAISVTAEHPVYLWKCIKTNNVNASHTFITVNRYD